jgi:hypothetical protein
MPRCGEAFRFWPFLLPTLCRAAAKHFVFAFFCYQPYAALRRSISSLAFFCYQPYAALRRSISFLHFSAKNLMLLCSDDI